MNYSNLFPPNYSLILATFPKCEELKPVFAYGDTIYNPFWVEVRKDVEKHEEVHSKRQGKDPDLWWNKYLTDRDFRLEEELIACAIQYKFLKDTLGSSKLTDWALENIATSLSGELYNLGISFGEVKSKIRNRAKVVLTN